MRKFLAGLCALALAIFPIPSAMATQTPVTGNDTNPTLGASCTYTGIQFKTPDNIAWVCADADGDLTNEWVIRDLPVCNADPPTSPTCTANTQHVCQIVTAGQFKIYGCDGTNYDLVSGGSGDEITVDGTAVTSPADFTSDATSDVDFTFNGTSTIKAIVKGIQQRAVASTAPTHGQVLEWDATANNWKPATDDTGSGSASAWAKGLDEDQDGTNPQLYTDDAADKIYSDMDQDGILTGEEFKLLPGRFAVPYPSGGFIFDADNETGMVRAKLCTADLFMFYDADVDGTYDANDDYCWGVGGYDLNCDCVPDSTYDWSRKGIDQFGDGSSPALEFKPASNLIQEDLDEDDTMDLITYANKLIDTDGDGILDTTSTIAWGSGYGDGASNFYYHWFPTGYSSDPFDYSAGMELKSNSAGYTLYLDAVCSDPNSATIGDTCRINLGTSASQTHWNNGYFLGLLVVGNTTFNTTALQFDEDSNHTVRANGGLQFYADFDEDGSASNKTIGFDADGDATGNDHLEIDASAQRIKFDPDGDGVQNLVLGTDVPAHGEVHTWDGTAGAAVWSAASSGSDPNIPSTTGRPYKFIELFEDFLRPSSGPTLANDDELSIASDNNSNRQTINNGATVDSFTDQDGTVTVYASGVHQLNVVTTDNNDAWSGFGALRGAEATAATENVWQLKKVRLFRARWSNNLVDAGELAQMLIGGMGESVGSNISVTPDNKDTGAYFFCDPDADVDDDGAAGDAEDDNIWAVLDLDLNGTGAGGDTVCLVNGSSTCAPDAARTAVDTGYECTGTTTARGFFYTVEIEFDGTSNWTFRLDDDTDDSAWDWTSGTTFNSKTPTSNMSVFMWGGALRNGNQAAAKNLYLDYLYYYGVRFN